MAIFIIPKSFQRVWDEWNLRGAILVSLWLQILLIFLSPLRKRTRSYTITIIIWLAYLLADWIAVYSIGIISNNQSNDCEKASVNNALAAFWAPFLLLHLGGPDSITAFSLEDNELWLRHLFSLIVELLMVAYVFSLALPNVFWLPTIVMFVAGMIKYAERTLALYRGCLGHFELKSDDEPSPDETNTSEHYMEIDMDEMQVVQEGYKLYKIFRGLIVGRSFSKNESRDSKNFFTRLTQRDAFKIMEVEFNFMYDELFTKMASVHRGHYGYIFRFTCTILIAVAFLLFMFYKKPNIHRFDIAVTYALLIGAIILDFVALIKIFFSDWTIALLKNPKMLLLGMVYSIHERISVGAHWSENMSQHSLINFCLKKRGFEWLDTMMEFFGLSGIFHELCYKQYKHVDEELKEFIFNELKRKAGTAIEQGDLAIVRGILPYDKSVLVWHIATDLLYFTLDEDEAPIVPDHHHHREICKILSDYMLYLLVMRPTLMSAVAGVSQIRFHDTCKETMKLIHSGGRSISEQRDACEKLLSIHIAPESSQSSVLFDACKQAKELKNSYREKNEMWEMMSRRWLELVCYGAGHCKGNAHAQLLSRGGELITFVWLLMAHFQLGYFNAQIEIV